MSKKPILFLMIFGAAALGVPQLAHGEAKNLTHSGAPLGKNATITLTGTVAFTSSAGGISCPTTFEDELEPGSTGRVKQAFVTDTKTCTFSGNLDALCGTLDHHTITIVVTEKHATKSGTLNWLFRSTSTQWHFGGTGIFCPDVTITGGFDSAVDNRAAIGSVTLSGTLESNLGTSVTMSGEMAVSPSGTYGMEA